MKKTLLTLSVGAFVVASSLSATAEEKLDLKNETAKFGYAQGFLIGQRFKQKLARDKVDLGAFALGMKDALTAKPQMTVEQLEKSISAGPVHLRAAKEKRKKENAAYLATNKGKDGVKTTASGLQYKVLKSGPADGKSPKATDTVVVHYKGTLVDGSKFDSSYDRGKPATFGVNQVIPGWSEVLQLMKPGDKWAVVIPPELGYGKRGAGGKIGPDAVLLFDVELIKVK